MTSGDETSLVSIRGRVKTNVRVVWPWRVSSPLPIIEEAEPSMLS